MPFVSGVRKFIDDTIVECRKRGFIVTLGGRRRYLPNINLSEGGFARGAAERQAINSTVQVYINHEEPFHYYLSYIQFVTLGRVQQRT